MITLWAVCSLVFILFATGINGMDGFLMGVGVSIVFLPFMILASLVFS